MNIVENRKEDHISFYRKFKIIDYIFLISSTLMLFIFLLLRLSISLTIVEILIWITIISTYGFLFFYLHKLEKKMMDKWKDNNKKDGGD